jgi:hypothetical protein
MDREISIIIKQIQRKCFFDPDVRIFSISSVKVFFPFSMIKKEYRGDEHNFCTTLMEKTVGRIGILNSDLFSDQFFFSVWSVQNLRQLSLHGTNITPIQNSKMQPASSFIFSPVQLYSTCN